MDPEKAIEHLSAADSRVVLAMIVVALALVCLLLWRKVWEVQGKYEAALLAQVSNGNQRAVVDQGTNALIAEMVKRLPMPAGGS